MKNKAQRKKQYKTIYGTKCEKKLKKAYTALFFGSEKVHNLRTGIMWFRSVV